MIDLYLAPQHDPPRPRELSRPDDSRPDDSRPDDSRPDDSRPDGQDQHDELLARLEASYEFHTERLVRLTSAPAARARQTVDHDSVVASSRRALAAIAIALRDMADGRYGTCDGCGGTIPPEHLRARPETRYCASCRSAQAD